MKKSILFFSLFLCGAIIAKSQTVYNVGATKDYQEISAVWAQIKASTDTEFILNIDEGTYITGVLVGLPNKKITMIGAGADKTIMKGADLEDYVINTEQVFGPDAAIIFKSAKKVNTGEGYDELATNYELICEKMTFQNAGSANNNWAAGLIMAEAENQKYTFKNCMFKNIYARQGAIIGTTAQTATPVSFTMENCFVEDCGGYEHNNVSGMIFLRHGGELTLKNVTFMNNTFHMFNNRPNTDGADNNRKNGLYITVQNANNPYETKVVIDNVNILNTKLTAEATSTCPMIRIGSTSEFAANITTCDIKNLVLLNNIRTEAADCDLSFLSTLTPNLESVAVNAMSSVVDIATDSYEFTPIQEYTGATVGADLTYTSEAVNFEMDGELPAVFVNASGVKYVKKSAGQSLENDVVENLDITTQNGVLSVRNLSVGTSVSVFDFAGKEIKRANVQGTVDFTLDRGIYIVKVGSQVKKVIL